MGLLETPGRRLLHFSMAVGDAIQDLLYPHPCVVCGGEGLDVPFCPDCRDELRGAATPSCPRCAMPVGPFENLDGGCAWCRSRALGFDGAIAFGPYQGPIRDLCLRMKRLDGAWLARWMMDLLLEARRDPIARSGASAVAAVPLHWRRRWSRGYNQADALADRLASRLKLPRFRGLRRVLPTPKLAGLSRLERNTMLRKSFRARPLSRPTVLLIDDILTTGATCGAAARALKAAGAARVIAVVLARA